MGNTEDKQKHIKRLKNHIAKDLRKNKTVYDQRIVNPKKGIYDRNKLRNIEVELDNEDDN